MMLAQCQLQPGSNCSWVGCWGLYCRLQVHRITVHADKSFDSTAQVVCWAIDAAAKDSCLTASYRATHSLMLLLLERASQLQPFKQPALARILTRVAAAKGADRHSSAAQSGDTQQFTEQVHKHQMQLLQKAEDAAQASLRLFAVQKQQWAAEAEGSGVTAEQLPFTHMPHEAVEAVQRLLEKIPKIKKELSGETDAAEVAAVLAALMKVSHRRWNLVCVTTAPLLRERLGRSSNAPLLQEDRRCWIEVHWQFSALSALTLKESGMV